MSRTRSIPVGEAAEYIRGINFKPDDVVPLGTAGSVGCMRTKNVQRELDVEDVWGVPESFVRRAEQFLQSGDVLISSANSWNLVGKCCWIPELPWRATFGGFVSVLRANPRVVEPRYFYRWFASERTQATLRSFGRQTTNISNLDVARCLAMQLPLPSLEEQRRISQLLDRVEALSAKRRVALTRLDELAFATFTDLFGDPTSNPRGWRKETLLDHATVTYGFPFDSAYFSDSGAVPVVRIRDVVRGTSDTYYTGPEAFQHAHRVRDGEILVGMDGEFNCARWQGGDALLNQRVCRFAATSQALDEEYLYYFLPRELKRIEAETPFVTVKHLSARQIRSIQIPLPPMPLQREFAVTIARINLTREMAEKSLEMLDALFLVLQSRAFTSEL